MTQEKLTNSNQIIDLDFVGGTSSKYDKIYYAKMHTLKEEPPSFTLKYKVDNYYQDVLTEAPIMSIMGNLLKIAFGSYTWKNREVKTVIFTFESESGKNLIILSCSYTAVLRSMINCMLKYNKKIEFLQIELYRNKSNGYNAIKCFINRAKEPGRWLYDMTKLNSYYDKVVINKKEVSDDSRLNEFLEIELRKHIPIICPQCEVTKIVDEPDNNSDEVIEPSDEMVFGISSDEKIKKSTMNIKEDMPTATVEEISNYFEVDDIEKPKDYGQQLIADPSFFK
jgi:hypothetical protein